MAFKMKFGGGKFPFKNLPDEIKLQKPKKTTFSGKLEKDKESKFINTDISLTNPKDNKRLTFASGVDLETGNTGNLNVSADFKSKKENVFGVKLGKNFAGFRAKLNIGGGKSNKIKGKNINI